MHHKSTRKDSMRKEVIFPKENGKFIFHSQMDESHFLEEIRNLDT